MPGNVFISFSHKDEGAKDELQSHLAVAVSAGKVELWEDRQIGVGDDWEAEIEKALNECSAAILLISRHFLSSGFINGVEVPKLLQRRQDEGLRLFSVVWSACDWKAVEWLPAMNMFPRDAKPMRGMSTAKRDEQFATFAEMVRQHIQSVENIPSADKEIRDTREAVQAAAERLFANVGDNRRKILEAQLQAGLLALTAGGDASKSDIADLVDLQLAMDGEASERKGLTFSIKGLSKLMAAVSEIKARSGEFVELDEGTRDLIENALRDVELAILSGEYPACIRNLAGLKNVLADALCTDRIRLGQVSYRADLVQEADRNCIEAGRTSIQVCVGLNLDKAPPLSAFRERLSIGRFAPVMVVMPTGRFLMGSPDTDEDAQDNEKPQHEVEISERIAIGRYPVTFDEFHVFHAVVAPTPSSAELWGGGGRSPVINVQWRQAQGYIAWLNTNVSDAARELYRLPSEAEWEYTCRAGSDTRFPWGHQFEDTQIVEGTPHKNQWGSIGMLGGVLEFCADNWEDNYIEPRRQNPFPTIRNRSILSRGGPTLGQAKFSRSAHRIKFPKGGLNEKQGFRLARSLD